MRAPPHAALSGSAVTIASVNPLRTTDVPG
jgi:hypothetical protein